MKGFHNDLFPHLNLCLSNYPVESNSNNVFLCENISIMKEFLLNKSVQHPLNAKSALV